MALPNVSMAAVAQSSSSRRTWIEIGVLYIGLQTTKRRPPRGGRGLKFDVGDLLRDVGRVVLLAEDVD